MSLPRCYCDQSPRDAVTGQRRFLCNVCVNAIIEEKNRLVKENWQLTGNVGLLRSKEAVSNGHL